MDSDSENENEFNPDFQFDFEQPLDVRNDRSHERESTLAEAIPSSLDQIIANIRQKKSKPLQKESPAVVKRKRKTNSEASGEVKAKPLAKVQRVEDDSDEEMEVDEDSDDEEEEEEENESDDTEDSDDDDEKEDKVEDDDSGSELEDKVSVKQTSLKAIRRTIPFEEDPEAEKFKFADDITEFDQKSSFVDFKLSRVVLKGLSDLGFIRPTPVQSACIPLAMALRDICACARTGSGKTGAFLVPLLERLLRDGRPTRPMTRALVLSPTRELALQIYEVAQKLVRRCPQAVRVQLSAGGIDSKRQEGALRKCPDVVVATPGRLIDHLCNTPSFNLRDIQMLVLDEADKMLDDNFAEQLKEILRQCSPNRQTLLFSATMTETVKDLAAVSLRSPARVFVNENTDVALRLQQEFVRVRPNQENAREAMILALVCRHFHRRTIVFAPTKRYCHRLRILLALSGIAADELHGNLRQPERLEALEKFAKGETAVLVATDLAARGLDVEGVQTVLNVCLPATLKQYVHRVGRTARAGKSGLAVSLAGESERRLLKAVVKRAPLPVKARVIPAAVLERFQRKASELAEQLQEVVQAESVARQERDAAQALEQAEKALQRKTEKRTKSKEAGNKGGRVDWFKEQKAALKTAKMAAKKSAKQRKFSQRRRGDDSD